MSVGAEDSIFGVGVGVEPRRRRRSWSASEKRRIVAETLEPGTSVSVVARRHDVNANQVFTWRRQMREGLLGGEEVSSGFVPVVVGARSLTCGAPVQRGQPGEPNGGSGPAAQPPAGRMEIALASGLIRSLVDRITLTPNDEGKLDIDLFGDLAGILSMAANKDRPLDKSDRQRSPSTALHGISNQAVLSWLI